VSHSAVASFSSLQQFCAVGRGIFNTAAVNILLSVSVVILISRYIDQADMMLISQNKNIFRQLLNC